ncbi:hypothetical protein K2173_023172 [Erythroxylum novogranatense]|uniref:Mitochondrial pyruvate carrier n=1 Tax=Erythroxylum novogranatense TaxID=1862640 RepID=A0AAV8U7X7_9ROSI|nr:hypothetical protein K2173_023172 [Erythroxylum novogranatense]
MCLTRNMIQHIVVNPLSDKTTHLSMHQIHFWVPTFKWGISVANFADSAKPPDKISYPQQIDCLLHARWDQFRTIPSRAHRIKLARKRSWTWQLSRKIQQQQQQLLLHKQFQAHMSSVLKTRT